MNLDDLENAYNDQLAHERRDEVSECREHEPLRRQGSPCPIDRIAVLEARYKAASGLALSWGNYFNRQLLEEEIDRMVSEEGEAK